MSLMSQIDDALHKVGLSLRGGLHIASEDGVETIYLVGHGGSSFWPYFKSSQYIDLEENPLDNWSKHVVGQLARDIGCSAIFPSDGPPYAPFQQWVMQAEPVKQSPIGLVLHPEFGLWHAYRAALKVSGKHELPTPPSPENICLDCIVKPCLSACPVDAFKDGTYDIRACVDHIVEEDQKNCRTKGCNARHACPVGQGYAYDTDHAEFHMAAFIRSHSK